MTNEKQTQAHRTHNHRVIDPEEFKIRNVAYTLAHDLVRCEDGFFGWIAR